MITVITFTHLPPSCPLSLFSLWMPICGEISSWLPLFGYRLLKAHTLYSHTSHCLEFNMTNFKKQSKNAPFIALLETLSARKLTKRVCVCAHKHAWMPALLCVFVWANREREREKFRLHSLPRANHLPGVSQPSNIWAPCSAWLTGTASVCLHVYMCVCVATVLDSLIVWQFWSHLWFCYNCSDLRLSPETQICPQTQKGGDAEDAQLGKWALSLTWKTALL